MMFNFGHSRLKKLINVVDLLVPQILETELAHGY